MATQILIVEDERIIAEDLKMMLTNLGFEVCAIVDNGEQALTTLDEQDVDLVLMDIKIRGAMNGIETAERLTENYDLPVVYLTAFADENTVERIKQTDAYGFIVKPANEQTIQGTVELALFKHGMTRKLRERDMQLEHLNQVLMAIRNVSQLITKEVNVDRLIQGACENLTETMGYQRAWIGLSDDQGKLVKYTFSGINANLQSELKKAIQDDKNPPCVSKAMRKKGLAIVENPSIQCGICSKFEEFSSQSRFSMRLEYQNKVYGILSVGVPNVFADRVEEQELFIELAEDIAFALYRLELEALQFKSAEALREEKAFTELALNAQSDTFFVFDPETGRALRWNKAFEQVSGYDFNEIAGLSAPDSYYSREDLEKTRLFSKQILNEKSGMIELTLIAKSGRGIPYEYYVTTIDDPVSGKTVFVSVGRDITERRHAEAKIRSLAKFPAENPNPVLRFSSEGKLLYANEAAASLLTQFLGSGAKRVKKFWIDRLKHLYHKSQPEQFEIAAESRYFQVTLAPAPDFGYINLYAMDITERKQATLALCESEARYRSLSEKSPIGILVHSKGRIVYVNSEAVCLAGGQSPEDLIGRPILDLVHKDYKDIVKSRVRETQSKQVSSPSIYEKFIRLDGSVLDVEVTANYVEFNGEPASQVVFKDISDKVRAENELLQKNRILNAMIENTDEYIMIADREAKPVWYNQAYANVMKELIDLDMQPGVNPHKLLKNPEARLWWDSLHKRVLHGEQFHEEFEFPVDRNHVRYFEVNYFPICEQGEVTGFTEFTKDVTKRKMIEKALSDNEIKYQTLVENMTDSVYMIDANKKVISINSAAEKLLHGHAEDVVGKSIYDIFPTGLADKYASSLEQVFATGTPLVIEREMTVGSLNTWLVASLSPIKDSAGHVTGVIGVSRDISARKKIEQTLRESETKYRLLAEHSSDVIWTFNLEGRFVYVSPSVKVLSGFSDKEVMKQGMQEALVEKSFESVKRMFTEFLADKNCEIKWKKPIVLELEFFCKDRTIVKTETHIKAVYDQENIFCYFLGVSRDITERKQVEDTLRESEQKLKNIIRHSDEIYYIHDTNHLLTYVSPQSKEIMGYSPEEMRVKWKDLMTDHPINRHGIELTNKAIQTGKKQPHYVVEVLHKSGEKRFVEVSESPMKNDQGRVVNIVGALRDVTDRIHSEDELLKRMKELEKFNSLMVGRENKIVELKREINELYQKMGMKKKFRIPKSS